MNKLILIAAIGKNKELGRNNDLIWHIKGDMKFFKERTLGHTMLMGKNTFVSLPKILPGRKHIILSKSSKSSFPKEVVVVNSLDEFDNVKKSINDDIYVIGGAKVYNEMINVADIMYLTEIDAECKDADVYFPSFKDEDWQRIILEEHLDNNPPYKHIMYKKKSNNY